MDSDVIVTVNGCARCGKDHHDLTFWKFTQPIILTATGVNFEIHLPSYNYWGMCPDLHEPILMMVTDDEGKLV